MGSKISSKCANPLSYGGAVYTATSVFSSGIGVTSEEYIPYRGKNEDAKKYLIILSMVKV